MRHLGDITKINWFEVEPVDCVTGGSPCQDLSVAGKRAGLAGERSGLYMEQIRCIKELRQRDIQSGRTDAMVRPRWMVWENVPGAFSSNGGKDFAAVLEEAVKIVEPQAPPIPVPDKGWPSAGCLSDVDGRWSITWRVHDAQFWGVPQRRKRIALVCDFGGMSAPEVLFERKGLSRDTEQSEAQREETARTAGNGLAIPIHDKATRYRGGGPTRNEDGSGNGLGVGREGDPAPTLSTCDRHSVLAIDVYSHAITGDVACSLTAVGAGNPTKTGPSVLYVNDQGGSVMSVSEDVSSLLRAQEHGHQPIVAGFKGGQGKGSIAFQEEIAATLQAEGSGIEPTVYDARGNGNSEIVPTITGDHQNRITDYTAILTYQQVTGPLMANSHPGSYCGQDAYSDMLITAGEVQGIDCRNGKENGDLCGTLQSKPNGGFSYNCIHPVRINQTVRRLTPLECERLQGYPDGWTDIGEWIDSKGKKHKEADSPRYKALGNSIALPFWFWLLRRISARYERPATLGSLFDGIGGFPLCWERCNGKGTALWASEIEEFPMAVTKKRFGEG